MASNYDNKYPGENSNPYKTRYKGVEKFLRRVAFNLGNSPSQTEVKIISCIPIDVTDLQAKIISLQRQLQSVKKLRPVNSSTTGAQGHNVTINRVATSTNPVYSAQYGNNNPLSVDNTDGMSTRCDDGSSKVRESMVSFLFPSQSSVGFQHKVPIKTTTITRKRSPKTSVHRNNYSGRGKKKKIIAKKLKPKTQLVYYAHTENGPFYNYRKRLNDAVTSDPKANVKNVLSKSYLANVVQRHFDPDSAVEEFSETSNFTSPVCRDFSNNGDCLYESDVCSCCHGQFQNVDKYLGKTQNYFIEPIATHPYRDLKKNMYYDSKYYDVVPVKEKAHKIPKDDKIKRELKRQVDMRCWPENLRKKSCHDIEVEHHTKTLTSLKNDRKAPDRLQITKNKARTTFPNGPKENKVDKETALTNTSNSCVDFSEIYPKTVNKTEKPATLKTKFRQKGECLTIDVGSNNLPITRSVQIDLNLTENKNEDTLNQIKSILQSVLTEVKTNSQINNSHESKSKRDAVTQKGPSQSNLRSCSAFATCSRQIASNLCYTNIPYRQMKYTQHFPLLIHVPGNHNCGCLYKSNGRAGKPIQTQAATTATNTDAVEQEKRGKEKEKLIKEIYKSIIPSIDFPKETSSSEVDLRFVTKELNNISNFKDIKESTAGIPNVLKRDIQIEATMTVKSKYNVTSSDARLDTKKIEPFLHYESQSTETNTETVEEPCTRARAAVAFAITEHDSEDLSNEDEDEANKLEVKVKTERTGFLQRVLDKVKLFNKKKRNGAAKLSSKKNKIEIVHCESDSDDYQTVHSEKTNNIMQQPNNRRRSRPKMYTTHKPIQHRASRKSPYMEQELRREWNERLTFRANRGEGNSSEQPSSNPNRPLYWQNYEARCAILDQSGPYNRNVSKDNPVQNVNKVGLTSPISVVNKKYENNKTDDKLVKEAQANMQGAVEKVYTRKLIK